MRQGERAGAGLGHHRCRRCGGRGPDLPDRWPSARERRARQPSRPGGCGPRGPGGRLRAPARGDPRSRLRAGAPGSEVQRRGLAWLRDAGRLECGRGGVRCRRPGDAGPSRRGDRPGARRPATLIPLQLRPGGRRGFSRDPSPGPSRRRCCRCWSCCRCCSCCRRPRCGWPPGPGCPRWSVPGAARGGEGLVVVPAHDPVGPGRLVPEVGALSVGGPRPGCSPTPRRSGAERRRGLGAGLGALGRALARGVGAGLVASVGQALRRNRHRGGRRLGLPAGVRLALRVPALRVPANLCLAAGLCLTACLGVELGLALQLLGLPAATGLASDAPADHQQAQPQQNDHRGTSDQQGEGLDVGRDAQRLEPDRVGGLLRRQEEKGPGAGGHDDENESEQDHGPYLRRLGTRSAPSGASTLAPAPGGRPSSESGWRNGVRSGWGRRQDHGQQGHGTGLVERLVAVAALGRLHAGRASPLAAARRDGRRGSPTARSRRRRRRARRSPPRRGGRRRP